MASQVNKGTKVVAITVNGQRVEVEDREVSGLGIKQAAIDQGVRIEIDFLLAELLGGNRRRIIGDGDTVRVNKNSEFIATAPDDNS
ncbi:MAG: multiubiquitin domain-containing protein [Dehalococcoidia bacterium]